MNPRTISTSFTGAKSRATEPEDVTTVEREHIREWRDETLQLLGQTVETFDALSRVLEVPAPELDCCDMMRFAARLRMVAETARRVAGTLDRESGKFMLLAKIV